MVSPGAGKSFVLGSEMRIVAVIVGSVLLLSGGALVVIADQQRVAALEAAKAAGEKTRQELAELDDANADLEETLAALRAQIAEQEKQLADMTGLLQ
jgi:septal ring factor EnvC (AmiA/AmiB activator)